MEENQDTGLETEPQKNYRGKSPRNRLLDRVKQLDSLSRNKELKLAKLADVQLEIASLERLLYNDSREDRNSETLTELATATEQLTQANAEIARLTQANAELRASQTPRVNALNALNASERIPDSALQQITTLEELLKAVSTLARGVDVDARTRHAVSLVVKHGKRAMSVVEGLGVDFSACASSLQKPESELLGLLSAAQQEGTGTPIWRAVLAVKYEIQVDGHGKRQHPDVFAESSLYADRL